MQWTFYIDCMVFQAGKIERIAFHKIALWLDYQCSAVLYRIFYHYHSKGSKISVSVIMSHQNSLRHGVYIQRHRRHHFQVTRTFGIVCFNVPARMC